MKFYKHVNGFFGKMFIYPSLWKKAEERYCKKSSSIVVVTDLAKKELVERVNINKKKVVVFSNSVSKSFYTSTIVTNGLEATININGFGYCYHCFQSFFQLKSVIF